MLTAVAVVTLLIFSLIGANQKPTESTPAQEPEAGKIEVVQAPSVVTSSTLGPSWMPDEVKAARCKNYASLPSGIVPCREALEFVLENYGSNFHVFGLVAEDASGKKKPATGTEQGKLFWFALTETTPSPGQNATAKPVYLDATDLSVASS